MDAIRIHEFGGPKVLIYEDIPVPEIMDGQVLVKVYATSVNHLEVAMTAGEKKDKFPVQFPWIPGFDFAGVVDRVGSSVTDFTQGDHVYGKTVGGTYAEYLALDAKDLARKPVNLTFIEAAFVPHVGLTAWQALYRYGQVEAGQHVLIHGGAGVVGAYAVQFARQSGAHVYATASAADRDFVQSLGAGTVIDYHSTDFTTVVKDMDMVLATVGGDTLQKSYGVLKPGGHLISLAGPVDQEIAKNHQVEAVAMVVSLDGEDLKRITPLMESGQVICDVGMVYALEDARHAWETFLHNTPEAKKMSHGKIVMTVTPLLAGTSL
ncbi:MAG: NADP-dependent oxidoreductase [Tannerellaceae bacterium]|nr:NADP-dependent oxidoreductase [Tannerellaceae bacterium]